MSLSLRSDVRKVAEEHMEARGKSAQTVAACILADAIYELASAVSDIGPAIKELASGVDHTSQLGDVATAVDDLSQSITRAANE